MATPAAPARPANAAPAAQQNEDSPWSSIIGVIKVSDAFTCYSTSVPRIFAANLLRLDGNASWYVTESMICISHADGILQRPSSLAQRPTPNLQHQYQPLWHKVKYRLYLPQGQYLGLLPQFSHMPPLHGLLEFLCRCMYI
jgi:hypothetical protein